MRAMIYISDDTHDVLRAEGNCLAYCERHGYQVVALVYGDRTGSAWTSSVQKMVFAREVDVVVLLAPDHLPPERLPRMEYVTDEVPAGTIRRRRWPRPRKLDR